MLVPPESSLRRVPVNLDARTVGFLDAIRYSFEIIDLAQGRLETTLERIATRPEGHPAGALIVEATADAWLLVDSLHRLRELVQQCPGLRQNESEVQLLLRGTSVVEGLRNYV